jgi:hypothetical protein
MRTLALVCALIAPRVTHGQAIEDDPRRPPPLRAPPECQLFRGSARGNDPTQLVEMVLCVDGSAARGTFQTSSLRSGWSKRSFVGAVIEPRARLSLRETAFIDDRPNPRWRFCLIDRYDLRFTTATHVESDYHSSACRDDGHISMDLVEADAGAPSPSNPAIEGSSVERSPLTEQPRVVVAPPDLSTVHARRRGWRSRLQCSARGTTGQGASWRATGSLVGAAFALAMRRRRDA